jgi:hypothetical protein
VETCIAAILPTLRDTIQNVISGQTQPQSQAQPPQPTMENNNFTPSVLQFITAAQATSGTSFTAPTASSHTPGMAKPVGLGVDPKIKAKILSNEYVKFATLLPKSSFDVDEKFRSEEKDGQLMFVKSSEAGQIRNINVWLEAFHIFVAIYCSKFPSEEGHLMTYAQIIQCIAKSCGEDTALDYDEKFRQWRQVAPSDCPWNQKNPELFQDAMAKCLENKQKLRKQPFRPQQPRTKYCFAFNNKGTCTKGNSCTFPHICQYCSGKHSKRFCKQKQSPSSFQPRSNNSDGAKKPTNATK